MNKQLKGFMDFVRTHGVVGLAVGLAIGTQVGKTVGDIVVGFINPIVGFIVGNPKGLEAAAWHIEAGSRSMDIGWGLILSSLITLLAVSAVIYWVVNGLKLDKLDKVKD
jgi:large conductance mechanosensitive channel